MRFAAVSRSSTRIGECHEDLNRAARNSQGTGNKQARRQVSSVATAQLKIGVVPVINLEWISKIHRDCSARGYSTAAVMDTMLRRMPDYVHYVCPQFTETDINFQRVPTVDTSNPFAARWIPTADESMVIIRFAKPRGIDFSYLHSMIHDSFMSRANSIVIPGAKLDLAMQLILTRPSVRRAAPASGLRQSIHEYICRAVQVHCGHSARRSPPAASAQPSSLLINSILRVSEPRKPDTCPTGFSAADAGGWLRMWTRCRDAIGGGWTGS